MAKQQRRVLTPDERILREDTPHIEFATILDQLHTKAKDRIEIRRPAKYSATRYAYLFNIWRKQMRINRDFKHEPDKEDSLDRMQYSVSELKDGSGLVTFWISSVPSVREQLGILNGD